MTNIAARNKVPGVVLFVVFAAYLALLAILNVHDFYEITDLIQSGKGGQMGACYSTLRKYYFINVVSALPPIIGMAIILFRKFMLRLPVSLFLFLVFVLAESSISIFGC